MEPAIKPAAERTHAVAWSAGDGSDVQGELFASLLDGLRAT